MAVVDREELAWAAGFFDGEGTTRNRPVSNRGRIPPFISVAQSERYPLDRMQKALLGLGAIRGPYGPYKTQKKPFWIYTVCRISECIAVIGMLWSWLGPTKRLQARKAFFSFYATPLRKRGPRAKAAK